MLYSIDINSLIGSIPAKEKKSLLYSTCAGIVFSVPISNVGIENAGSAGQVFFIYWALVQIFTRTKFMFFLYINFSLFCVLLFLIDFLISRSCLYVRPVCSVHCNHKPMGALHFP